MRLLIIAWAAVVLCIRALAALAVRPGAHQALEAASVAGSVASFVEQGLLGLVVAILFLEDSPASTTGFLLTRPVSSGSVLRAKACVMALLLSYAVLADLTVLVVAQATPRDLALAVPHVLLKDLAVMLPAALLASVAPSLIRLLVWAAIVGAVYFVAQSLIAVAIQLNGPVPDGLAKSRTVVALSLLTAGVGVALVQQHRSRRSGASAIAGAATLILALAASCVWPMDFFAAKPPPLSDGPIRLRAALYETSLSDVLDPIKAGTPRKCVNGYVRLEGLPANLTALPKLPELHLTTSDGAGVPVLPGSPTFAFGIPRRALADTIGDDLIFGAGYIWDALTPVSLADVSASTLGAYDGQRLHLHGSMNFDLARYTPLYAMELSVGAKARLGPEIDIVTEVLRQPDAVEVLVRRQTITSLFARSAPPLTAPGYACLVPERQFYLINPLRHEAVEAENPFEYSLFRSETNDGLITEQTFSLQFGGRNPHQTPDLSLEWLADARLVEVSMQTEGSAQATLDRRDFTLAGNNYDQDVFWNTPPIRSEWFSRAPLAPRPSKEQARQFVDDVSAVVYGINSAEVQHSDLPQEAYARVGADNLDVLIAAADAQMSLFIMPVILRIATPANQAVVLRSLQRHPDLVDLVVKFHWEQQARPTLLSVLADPRIKYLPKNWVVATAALHDPSTYPLLLNYLIHGHGRWATYNAIRHLPGISIKPAVRQAWAAAQGDGWMNKVEAAQVAAQIGLPDALDTLIQVLRINDVGHPEQFDHAVQSLRRLTPATGDAGSIVAWYDAHRAHLTFDPRLHRFVPST